MSTSTIEHVTATGNEIVTRSGNAAIAGFQELAKAYQALATKNAARLSAALQALAGVKSPTEFTELQTKLIAEGIEAAVRDGNHIAKLTGTIFTSALEPAREHLEAHSNGERK